MAVVPSEAAPLPVDHVARAPLEPGVAAEELALALPGEEAEVLALRATRNLEARPGRDLADLGLGQLAQGETQARQGSRAQPREHVGLILGSIGWARQQGTGAVVDDPRVVPGREPRGAETVGEGDHRVDPQVAVAEHAWIRGPPLCVAAQERAHHPGAELALQVQRQVWEAERVSYPAGAEHRLGGAAAALAVGLLVGPELEGDGDHLIPRLPLAQRGHRGIDAAADGYQDALAVPGRVGDREPRAG